MNCLEIAHTFACRARQSGRHETQNSEGLDPRPAILHHGSPTLSSIAQLPYVQVGEGVKGLAEGDWVVPARVHMGSWRSSAVWKGSDLLKLPEACLPPPYAAVWRELCLAYRLLEDHGSLKVPTAHDTGLHHTAFYVYAESRGVMTSQSDVWRCS